MKKLALAAITGTMVLAFGATALADGDTLVMATNAYFEPYEYYDGDDIVGIDAEVAALIAEELGMELEIEDMEFDSVLAAVQTGKADIAMAGITVTEERQEVVSFSDPYTTATQVIIVAEGSEIASADDLAGTTVGVQLGTTGAIYAADYAETVEEYSKGFEAVQALLQGKIDAVVIDEQPAKHFVEQNEGLVLVDEPLTEEEYAIAVSKDNEELLTQINEALATLQESGEFQKVVDKYIGTGEEEETEAESETEAAAETEEAAETEAAESETEE